MAVAEAHPSAEDLAAFALGTLGEGDRVSVEAHVAACPSCQERAAVAPGDSLVELLRCAHAREARRIDTVAETAASGQTPAPLPASAETAAFTPAPADMSRGEAPEAVPPELARHERYRVVRLLGAGGMGTVYEAEHRVMQRPVALKVISRAFTARPAAVERFRREARAAARLSHPNIVTTHDAEDAGDTLFLVMEYVEGTTLGRLVKERGPLPVAEACDAIRQAAVGLQHAHERGMVHRDVKPDNLIRCPDGTVKVLDFGLAALTAERSGGLTDTNVLMGTPEYMAPEQAEDPRSADTRADVYSLGCTLYHLLTGHAPYPAPTPLLTILAHREKPLPSIDRARPDVPAGLACVLERMLAKRPEDRYQTPGEVAAALGPFTAVEAAPRRPRRRRLVAALAALLLAGVALAGTIVYRIQTDKGELVITAESDDVEVLVKQGGKVVHIIDMKTDKRITLALRSGDYELELKGAPEGLKLSIDRATLTRGETVLARIERVARPSDDRPLEPRPLEVAYRFPWPGRNDLSTWFSDDGRLCVAWAPGAFRVWEVATGKLVRESAGVLPYTVTVRFLPDGKQLLSSHADGTFRRWDLATGDLLAQIHAAPGWYQLQGFSSEGDAFGSIDERARVWDLKAGKERFAVNPVEGNTGLAASAPLSPDGKRMLTVDYQRRQVRIFDVATGKQLLSKSITLRADIAAWSADGRSVYLNAGAHIHRLDAETGELISDVRLVPEPGSSFGRRFSRDARYFAVQYPAATLIHLYDTHTGKLVGTASGPNSQFSLSFSPTGQYAACGGQGEVILYRVPEPPGKDKR
jgi:WD40 repeat protein